MPLYRNVLRKAILDIIVNYIIHVIVFDSSFNNVAASGLFIFQRGGEGEGEKRGKRENCKRH